MLRQYAIVLSSLFYMYNVRERKNEDAYRKRPRFYIPYYTPFFIFVKCFFIFYALPLSRFYVSLLMLS